MPKTETKNLPKADIYTRTGDKGETSLFTGQRVPKDDPFVDALGAVDEANSAIGAAVSFLPLESKFSQLKDDLELVQHALFDVGAALATPRNSAAAAKLNKTRFDHEAIEILETWIDRMNANVPELRCFILPGGHPSGAMLHLARSFCRRAERTVLPLHRRGDVHDNVLMYLNRLSDYLFMASRYANSLAGRTETSWEHHKMGS